MVDNGEERCVVDEMGEGRFMIADELAEQRSLSIMDLQY